MSDLPFVLLETFLKQCFLNGMRITWCHRKNNGIEFQEQLCYWFFFMLLKYSASFINQYNKAQSRWLLLLIRFDLDILGLQLQGLICFWKEMRTLTWLGTRRGTEVNCLPKKKSKPILSLIITWHKRCFNSRQCIYCWVCFREKVMGHSHSSSDKYHTLVRIS